MDTRFLYAKTVIFVHKLCIGAGSPAPVMPSAKIIGIFEFGLIHGKLNLIHDKQKSRYISDGRIGSQTVSTLIYSFAYVTAFAI